MHCDTTCYVQILGWLRIRVGDRVIARFSTQQTGALLACLAFGLDRSHPRDELIECVWPDVAPEAGRNRLRVALSSLRSELNSASGKAAEVLITDRHTVRLDSECVRTDLQDFQEALRRAGEAKTDAERVEHLTAAVSAYSGDLLTGFQQEWIVPEREHLSALSVTALCRLAALHETTHDYEKASSCAHRALSRDPYCEEACRILMRCLSAHGNAAGALLEYRRMRQRLHQRLSVPPSAETRAVLMSVRKSARENNQAIPIGATDTSRPVSPRLARETTAAPLSPGPIPRNGPSGQSANAALAVLLEEFAKMALVEGQEDRADCLMDAASALLEDEPHPTATLSPSPAPGNGARPDHEADA